MVILKHLTSFIALLAFGFIAQFIKNLTFFLLSLLIMITELPIFTWTTGGTTYLESLWNLVIAATVAEAVFVFTVIFLNFLLIKKIFKWNLNFTPGLFFIGFLFIFKHVNTFFFSLEAGLFYPSTYVGLFDFIIFIIGFIFAVLATYYPLFFAHQNFDENGNWKG